MAVFGLQSEITDIDEVVGYHAGRYISSNKTVWRILSFPIHERSPAVVHLAVHLQNGRRVYFSESNVQQRALNRPDTTLTAFLALCQNDSFAKKKLLYSEVPTYYTWNGNKKSFERRKRGESVDGQPNIFKETTIGRIYTFHPNQDECFFLRLLLVNVAGPTSFEHLRTANGTIHDTYRSAGQALNLLENDHHWDNCINDACETSTPSQIRALFGIILTTYSPSSPAELWEKCKWQMAENILY
ncbi:uncharacterized protein LOC136030772 [Artemia franciscana]|uniref:uncharacterized protein LOC136030772 n=1 Tax=Artemia franciscana TaxID=6661 RepID=UPI0032D9C833